MLKNPAAMLGWFKWSTLPACIVMSLVIHGAALSFLSFGLGDLGPGHGGDLTQVSLFLEVGGGWAEIQQVPGNNKSSTADSLLLGDAFDSVPSTELQVKPKQKPTDRTSSKTKADRTQPSFESKSGVGEVTASSNNMLGGVENMGIGAGGFGIGGGGLLRARVLNASKPPYPPAAREAEFEGAALLLVTIDRSGAVREVSVSKRSGCDECDESAKRTIYAKWRFQPALKNGEAVDSQELIAIVFKLEER